MQGFTIRIHLQTMVLNGIEALDWRRARSLPDKAHVYADPTPVYFDIKDEAFIRAWFEPQETSPGASVHPDWLAQNELDLSVNGDRVVLTDDLPEARVQALFIRSRFATIESKMTEIQAKLEVTEALLNKEDEVD